MKILIMTFVLCVGLLAVTAVAQDDSEATEAEESLDLEAVAALFEESEDLESFEAALNDPENGVNNLDLDGDGNVDYIHVDTVQDGDTHTVVLQVDISETEAQDVATIDVQKTGEDEADYQVTGTEEIYGTDYYVESTTVVVISTYPVIRPFFRPGWRVFRSPYRWGRYPHWWHPRPVVAGPAYRSHVRKHHKQRYRRTKSRRMERSPAYHPRSSPHARHMATPANNNASPSQQQQKQNQQQNQQQQQQQQQKKQQSGKKKRGGGRGQPYALGGDPFRLSPETRGTLVISC